MRHRFKVATKRRNTTRKRRYSRKQKIDFSESPGSPIDKILHLQSTIGNQAVQRMMKSSVFQAQLRISQPNDKYEQEADRVADQVMRMPEPHLQRQPKEKEEEELQTKPFAEQITPLIQRQDKPEEEEEKEELALAKLTDDTQLQRQGEEPEEEEKKEEEEEPVQTKQGGGQTPYVSHGLETQIHSLKGGGQPLSKSIRNYFEPRFGYDFSGVRVHTGDKAGNTAKALNSRAFTLGNNIVFNQGAYSPETSGGKHLLAHELTHVIQQKNKGISIQRWGPSNHKKLTKEGINEIKSGLTNVDENAVNSLADYSTQMDSKLPELWFNFVGKLKGSEISLRSKARKIEALQNHYAASPFRAKNHGEGGLYMDPESKASRINLVHQKMYERKALSAFKSIPLFWSSITECESNKIRLRNEVFEILGDALHVAQDRGSHGEGAEGKGHAGEVLTGKSPDKFKNNPEGYRKAQRNTVYLLIRTFDILKRLLDKRYRSTCSSIGPALVEKRYVE